MSSSMGRIIPYMKWKIKFMFETTNQKFIGISCERNHVYLVGGWALAYPSEKYDFVSWDDDIPKIWEIKKNVPNHKPAILLNHENNSACFICFIINRDKITTLIKMLDWFGSAMANKTKQ